MKRILVLAALLGCNAHYYGNSEPTLMVGISAKDFCSCHFVLGRAESTCKDYARMLGPRQLAQFDIDRGNGVVYANIAGWHATARYLSPELGCVLE